MKFHSLCLTALTALTLSLSGCSNDDTITAPDGENDGDGVKFSFSIGVSSKGGEISRADSDDPYYHYDEGLSGERELNNAMILIYDRPLNAPDFPGDSGRIVKVIYIDKTTLGKPSTSASPTEATYFEPVSYYPQANVLNKIEVGTVKVSDLYSNDALPVDEKSVSLETGKRYYATAICNFGDLSKTFEGKSLKWLREYVYTGDLYDKDVNKNIKEYKNFRMSGINETSFTWERNTSGSIDLGYFLVQRLASRLDVMLGTAGVEFLNPGNYSNVKDIELAVYTPKENNDNELEIITENGKAKHVFHLTSLQIVNGVAQDNSTNSGVFLIERSSKEFPSSSVTPVFLDNEGWKGSFPYDMKTATKYVWSPSKKTRKTYPLCGEGTDYPYLSDLISSGSFFSENSPYTDNKTNSSVVGYISENTNSEQNYTVLRIEGYTNAATSSIFTIPDASRADYSDMTHVVGEIPIMHSRDKTSTVMRYAVVRNTIYRLRIKVVATSNNIYFRYYYSEPGNTTQKEYVVACFKSDVGDNNVDNPTIND